MDEYENGGHDNDGKDGDGGHDGDGGDTPAFIGLSTNILCLLHQLSIFNVESRKVGSLDVYRIQYY